MAKEEKTTIINPLSPSTRGFSSDGMNDPDDYQSVASEPEDVFDTLLDQVESERSFRQMIFTWVDRTGLIVLILLALSNILLARFANGKPQVISSILVVTKQCQDKTCKQFNVSTSSLMPITRNTDDQILIAQTLLPVIFHQAFSVSSPDQDKFDWKQFVLPYITPGSQAADFLSAYLTKNQIGDISSKNNRVIVDVFPISKPSQPNRYFIGWSSYTVGDGGQTAPQKNFVIVNTHWDNPTPRNLSGLKIDRISLVQEAVK